MKTLLFASILSVVLSSTPRAEGTVIRMGLVGNPFDKPLASGILGYAQEHKLFEQEFEKDGIRVQWEFYKGTGPAINEGLAGGKVDIASYGDLPAILGKSGGIPTRLIVPGSVGQNIYVGVKPGSTFRTIEDLKGKRVGYMRGTYLHLSWVKLLRSHGLQERDFKAFNLSQTDGCVALEAGHVDAYVGTNVLLDLKRKGGARILYSTNTDREETRPVKGFSAVVATEGFLRAHPDLARRWVAVYVRAAKASLEESYRETWIQGVAKPGYGIETVREDQGTLSLAEQNAPIFDARYLARLTEGVQAASSAGLIRRPIEVPRWIEGSYLAAAIATESPGWGRGFPAVSLPTVKQAASGAKPAVASRKPKP